MTVYFYENHCGGWYYTYDEQSAEDLYCDICGDSDTLIGVKEFAKEPKKEKIEEIGDKLYADYLKSWDLID